MDPSTLIKHKCTVPAQLLRIHPNAQAASGHFHVNQDVDKQAAGSRLLTYEGFRNVICDGLVCRQCGTSSDLHFVLKYGLQCKCFVHLCTPGCIHD